MRTTRYSMHRCSPDRRKLSQLVDTLRAGGVLLYPADTGFALGCTLSNREGIQRIRALRNIDDKKRLSFLCPSLSSLSTFAVVEDAAFRLIRRLVPGPYTFVLNATKSVPKLAQNPKRRTAGVRIPDHNFAQSLLEALDAPLISITAKDAAGDYIEDPQLLIDLFDRRVDATITLDSYDFTGESTVLDLTQSPAIVIRRGAGLDRLAEFMEFDDDA